MAAIPKLRKTATQERDALLIATIKKYLYLSGVEVPELCAALCMSGGTFYRRLKEPGDFTIEEISRMSQKLHIPKDEMSSTLLGK
ncbi:MAG: hypothetical protein Q8873_00450 [Bacillota bacterium]|nr:hypothetical protein [Bacillota bacterium]